MSRNKKVCLLAESRFHPNLMDFHAAAFRSIGWEVYVLGLATVKSWYCFLSKAVKPSLLGRHFKLTGDAEFPNQTFDLCVVYQSAEIQIDLLEKARARSMCLIAYWSDNPCVSGLHGLSWFREYVRAFDYIAVPSRNYEAIFYSLGAASVKVLPFGFDSDFHKYERIKAQVVNRLAYFGARNQALGFMLDKTQLPIDIYGGHWRKGDVTKAMLCSRGVGYDFPRVACQYPVVVNQTRPNHFSGVSMKLFELPAMGRVVIMNEEVFRYPSFEHGVHGLLYNTEHEYHELVERVSVGDFDLKKISASARDLISQFEYRVLIQEFLVEVGF